LVAFGIFSTSICQRIRRSCLGLVFSLDVGVLVLVGGVGVCGWGFCGGGCGIRLSGTPLHVASRNLGNAFEGQVCYGVISNTIFVSVSIINPLEGSSKSWQSGGQRIIRGRVFV